MMKKTEVKTENKQELKKSGLMPLTGVWEKTTKDGKPMWSGKTKEKIEIPAGSFVMVFENAKKSENAPDYNICYSVENAPL